MPGIALLFAGGAALAQERPSFAPGKWQRSIAITATAHVTHVADTATVHVGFLVYGTSNDAAYAAGSARSNAIIDALRGAGVEREAIESQGQQVTATPPYELNNLPTAEKLGRAFEVQQTWTVCVRADDAARVLDVATKAGADQSGQIDWSLSDPGAAQTEAAAKAMQRAEQQAAAMAQGLHVQVGPLLYASNEVEAEPVRPVEPRMRAMAAAVAAPQPLAITGRSIETDATVYAVFAIQ